MILTPSVQRYLSRLSAAIFIAFTIPLTYGNLPAQNTPAWSAYGTPGDCNIQSLGYADSMHAIAVGSSGTILRSTDGGTTWVDCIQGTTKTIWGVAFASSAVVVAVGDNGTILRSADSGNTWALLPSPFVNALRSIAFFDAKTGIAVGTRGHAVRTTDAGQTWNVVSDSFFIAYYQTRCDLYAVACNGRARATCTGQFGIFSTTDAGISWSLAANIGGSNGVICRSVSFANAQVGVAVGGYGGFTLVMRTNDSGATWTQQKPSNPIDFAAGVVTPDPATILIVGWFGNCLISRDSGATWSNVSAPRGNCFVMRTSNDFRAGYDNGLIGLLSRTGMVGLQSVRGVGRNNAVCMTTTGVGVVVGDHGIILLTRDSGATWRYAHSLTSAALNGVAFDQSGKVVAVGDNGIVRTSTDSGGTWHPVPSGTSARLNGVASTGFSTWCAAGERGTIVRSIDRGNTWSVATTPSHATLNSVAFTSAGICIAMGDSGTVLRSADSGRTWMRIPISDTVKFCGLACGTDDALVAAAGIRQTYSSHDLGLTWNHVVVDGINVIRSVAWIDRRTAVCAGDSGFIARSPDGGMSWNPIRTPVRQNLRSLCAFGGAFCIATGDSLCLIRSTTGGIGTTWVDQSGAENWGPLYSVSFYDASHSYILSPTGTVFASTDGGTHWVQGGQRTAHINCVIAYDPRTWIVVNDSGNFVRTSDAGDTWTVVGRNSSGSTLHHGNFLDASTGYVVGDNGALFRSTDAGMTWAVVPGNTHWRNDAWFISHDTGFAVGADPFLVRTTDAGRSWKAMTLDVGGQLLRIRFFGRSFALAVGSNGLCLRSTDGGTTWHRVATSTSVDFYVISHAGSRCFFIGGSWGVILRSLDSGRTWTRASTGAPPYSVYDIAFADDSVGIAVGDGSMILRTTDGGARWFSCVAHANGELLGVAMATADREATVGADGVILLTTDGGRHWNQSVFPTTDALNGVMIIDSHTVVVTGANGVIGSSPDWGRTWSVIHFPGRTFFSVAAFSDGSAIAVGDSGAYVVLGRDGAAQLTYMPTPWTLKTVRIHDGSTCLISAEEGRVFRSSDHGTSWHPVQNAPYLSSMAGMDASPRDLSVIIQVQGYSIYEYCLSSTHGSLDFHTAIWRTSNDGGSWTSVADIYYPLHDVTFVDSATVYFTGHKSEAAGNMFGCGSATNVARSTDGGITWRGYNFPETEDWNAIAGTNSANVTIVGTRGKIERLSAAGYANNDLFTFSPRQLNFGEVPVGESRCDTILVRNGTNMMCDGLLVSIHNWQFAVAPSTLQLAAGDSAYLVITFMPSTVGEVDGYVVMSNSVTGSIDTLAVTGIGTGGPLLTASRRALYFSANQYAVSSDSITVMSTGTAPLHISSVTCTDAHFKANPIAFTLAPGTRQSLGFTFSSDSVRRTHAFAVIASNAPSSPDTIDLLASTYSVVHEHGVEPREMLLSSIYPNPSTNDATLNFTTPTLSDVSISIWSMLGTEMSHTTLGTLAPGTYKTTLDVSHFPAGMYSYRITTRGAATVDCFIVAK